MCLDDPVPYLLYNNIIQEDDAELAKKLASLKWHEKELEVRILTSDR